MSFGPDKVARSIAGALLPKETPVANPMSLRARPSHAVASAIALSVLAGIGVADVVTYPTRAAFEADNSNLLLETFSAPFATAPSVDFGVFAASVDISLLAHLNGNSLQKQGQGPAPHTVTFTFDEPVYALAILIGDFGARGPGELHVSTDTASFDEQIAEVDVDETIDVFFAIRDDAGFTVLQVVNTTEGDSIEFDDLQFTFVRRPCPPDLTGSSDPTSPDYGVPDGRVNAADFFYFLDQFASGNLAIADLTGSADPSDPAYGAPDGVLDASDFFFYLDLFVAGCA